MAQEDSDVGQDADGDGNVDEGRRALLKGAVASVVLLAVPSFLKKKALAAAGEEDVLRENIIGEEEHGEGVKAHHDLPAWLDYATGGAVLGNFIRHVVYGGAIKGGELNARVVL